MIPFFAVLIAALVCAGPAHAGFLVPVVAGLFGGGAIATAAASILVGVGSSLVSRALQPKQKAQGPGAISIDAPTSGDGTPQTIILGGRAVAGHRTCPEYSRGNGKEWLTIVRDLSDMPINGLVSVWFGNDRMAVQGTQGAGGDVLVPRTTGADSGWFTPSGGRYAGKLRVRFYDGTQTAADPHLLAEYGSHPDRPWQADMRLLGVAYVIIELKRDQEVFPGIPDLLFEVEGIKLYDPRNGQMVWSNNLALIAYNVMRGIQMPDGSIYGGGLDDADLPLSSWAPAINEAGAQNWRGGLEVSVGPQDYDGDMPYEVIEHLLQGCAGQVAESGGVWRVRIGGPGLPVASVTDRDVVISENQVFMPHQGPREVYNGVTGQYSETAERWESKTTPLRIDPAYVARDGARNVVHLAYHAVTDSQQCQKLIQMALDDNRRQRTHELSLPLDYAPVEVLDTLSLSLPYDGYVGKLVEVTAKTTDPVTMGQRVFVREVDPNDFTPAAVTPLPTIPVVTTPLAPQPLPGWAVEPVIVQDAEGRNRRPGVRIMWTPLPAEGIEWELRSQGATALAGEGTTQEVEKGQRVITAGLINGTAMQIRGRAVLRNRARAWTEWTNFIAPNLGLGPLDVDVPALREEVLADLTILEEWLDGEDGPLQPLRDGVTQAQADLADARLELATDITAAETLAMDNLNIARAYTDTGLLNESVSRVTGDQALAAQIQTLTAVLNSENYLENPRFSNGLTGWSGFHAATTTVVAQDDGSSNAIIADAPTANFVQLVGTSGGVRDIRQDFAATFAENEVLQWRIYAGANEAGRTALALVQFYNSDGVQLGSTISTTLTLTPNAWRIFSGQHAAPAGTSSVRFTLRVPATASTSPISFTDGSVTRVDQSVIARITDLEVVVAENETAFTLHRNEALSRLGSNEAAITNEAATRSSAVSSLSGQITTVSATANARNRTFRQSTAPSGVVTGDIWYDTSANNRPRRWSGTAWIDTDDTRIAANTAAITSEQIARADADTALAGQINVVKATALSAGGSIFPATMANNAAAWRQGLGGQPGTGSAMNPAVTYFNGPLAGDHIGIAAGHSGNVHVVSDAVSEYTDGLIIRISVRVKIDGGTTGKLRALVSTLRSDYSNSRNLATGIEITPTTAGTWQTISVDFTLPARLSDEVYFRAGVFSNSAVSPDLPIFIASIRIDDITLPALNTASITNEAIARADGDSALASQIATVSAVANARNRTFRQNAAPSGPVTGDVWYDTANGNLPKRWNGSAWVNTDDTRIAQNAAAVTNEAAARATADNALANQITTVSARTDRGTATGLLRVSAEATPAGVTSRIGLRAEASAGGTAQSAALFLEATAGGNSQVVIAADRVSIATGNGTGASRRVPFVARNGNVFMGNAIVDTLSIGPNQVTVPAAQQLSSILPGNLTWRNANTISYTLPFAGSAAIQWFGSQGYVIRQSQAIGIRLRINGVVQWSRIAGDPNGGFTIEQDWLAMGWRRDLPAGTHSIQVDWWSNNANLQLEDRTLIVQGSMR
ncbi:phage tail protein [Paracoccus hibiscisoli]|uniref:DUF1983 domain-containing protein n=1 Tax=Paracoccus hibiscisoli TaxID=2023261 RepID=A0A4U0RDD5_9RHOB|nr:phage tail protein [Paracoccus hibiscisoli]TJZ86164.1 DUF1983 domain-containing protein [Paracoccus hibiscisoli]